MPVITVEPGGVRLRARAGETILAAVRASGFTLRTGCEKGRCGTCKADLLAGSVTFRRQPSPRVLPDAERAAGAVLPCQAVPDADVTIALRDDELRLVRRWRRLLRPAP